MDFKNKSIALILIFLMLSITIESLAQQWIETKKEITDVFDNELFIYGSIIAYVSDKNGKPKTRGTFVTIKNFSTNACYYRGYLDGIYRSQQDPYKRITLGTLVQYSPIPPKTTEIIDIGIGTYFTQAELKKMIMAYLEIKYLRESGKPNQQAETEAEILRKGTKVTSEDLVEPCDQILFKSSEGGVGYFFIDNGQQELLTSGVFAYTKLSDPELIKNCWVSKLEQNSITFSRSSIKFISFESTAFDKAFEEHEKMMFETYKDYNVTVINLQEQ